MTRSTGVTRMRHPTEGVVIDVHAPTPLAEMARVMKALGELGYALMHEDMGAAEPPDLDPRHPRVVLPRSAFPADTVEPVYTGTTEAGQRFRAVAARSTSPYDSRWRVRLVVGPDDASCEAPDGVDSWTVMDERVMWLSTGFVREPVDRDLSEREPEGQPFRAGDMARVLADHPLVTVDADA